MALVAADLAVFFLVYRPLGTKLEEAGRQQDRLRQGIRSQQVRVDALKRYDEALPAAGQQIDDFVGARTPTRREAYSTAAHLLHKVAEEAGVNVAMLVYHSIDKGSGDPLERLALDINVQGSYAGLVKFAHALETSKEFMLVRDGTMVPGENGALNLRLLADLYVKE